MSVNLENTDVMQATDMGMTLNPWPFFIRVSASNVLMNINSFTVDASPPQKKKNNSNL